MCFKKVVFVFFIFFTGAHAAPIPTTPLDLLGSVHFAIEHSPFFDSAKKTQAIRELEYKTSIAKMLPSADISATHGLQNNVPIASDGTLLTHNPQAPWYSSFSVGVTENLYDNGQSLTKMTIANLNRELAGLTFVKSRDALVRDVMVAFYHYSLAVVLVDAKKQQETILNKQMRMLSSQYQQGLKTKSDYLRLETQVKQAEIDRINADNNVELMLTQLKKTLGSSYQNPDSLSFKPIEVTHEQSTQLRFPEKSPDFEKTYDYRLTKVQESINEKNVNLVKRLYWPQVGVTSSATYSNLNYINSNTPFTTNHQLSWNALLTLQYNIWDWGSRARDVEVAKLNEDLQENDLNLKLLDTGAQMKALMSTISRIGRTYKLSSELLSLDEESYRNMESQYREGKVTYLDLITSLNNLLDAKVQFFTSYFEAQENLANYKYFEGTLYETLNIK